MLWKKGRTLHPSEHSTRHVGGKAHLYGNDCSFANVCCYYFRPVYTRGSSHLYLRPYSLDIFSERWKPMPELLENSSGLQSAEDNHIVKHVQPLKSAPQVSAGSSMLGSWILYGNFRARE